MHIYAYLSTQTQKKACTLIHTCRDIHTKARTSVHSHIICKNKIYICINTYQWLCISILVHRTHRCTATHKHRLIHTHKYIHNNTNIHANTHWHMRLHIQKLAHIHLYLIAYTHKGIHKYACTLLDNNKSLWPYVFMNTWTQAWKHIQAHLYRHIYPCTQTHVCMHAYAQVYILVYIYVTVMHAHVYMYRYIHIYTYLLACIGTYKWNPTSLIYQSLIGLSFQAFI